MMPSLGFRIWPHSQMNGYLNQGVYSGSSAPMACWAEGDFRCHQRGLHDSNIPRPQEHSEMADSHRMAEDAQAKLRDTADRVTDIAHDAADQAAETFRKASDKVNAAAKDGLKTARQFASSAQKYVEE